ncbi:hypothetical protein QVD17_04627 [Tagetes erecta]|uniref:Uncharacterized protein n=1 Tax=Tagetes erecta TaxID=13708 RepID=A0AAD8LGN2_TARER|nr:hypothetical protein QVD17_04627 [Tagetes erecta]
MLQTIAINDGKMLARIRELEVFSVQEAKAGATEIKPQDVAESSLKSGSDSKAKLGILFIIRNCIIRLYEFG